MKTRIVILTLFALVVFTGCATLKDNQKLNKLKQANKDSKLYRLNTYDVEFTEITQGKKRVRFIGMTDIGQPQFFENINRLLGECKKEGFVVFREFTSYESLSDTNYRKLRRLFGYVPKTSFVENQYKLSLRKGYQLRDD